MTTSPEITWRFDFTSPHGGGYFEIDPTNLIIPTSAAHPTTFNIIAADINIDGGNGVHQVHYSLDNVLFARSTPGESVLDFQITDFLVPGIARYDAVDLQLNMAPIWESWTTPDQNSIQLWFRASPFSQSTSWNDAATATRTVIDHNTAPTAVTLSNVLVSIAENTATAAHIFVADIAVADDGFGSNTLALTGADASFFEIVGTQLFLKAGTVLDFETKASYSVAVTVDDPALGSTPDASSSTYSLDVTDQAGSAINGTSGADIIDATHTVAGQPGTTPEGDRILGKGGDDTISGQAGNDVINGGAGNDKIAGGTGRDVLAGGAGHDTFVFAALTDSVVGGARDKIVDFVEGTDKIDLSAIDAIPGTSGDDGFHFVGSGPLKHAGDLRVMVAGNNTLISADVNGDHKADFQILLSGVHTLSVSDFIL